MRSVAALLLLHAFCGLGSDRQGTRRLAPRTHHFIQVKKDLEQLRLALANTQKQLQVEREQNERLLRKVLLACPSPLAES